MCIGGLVTCWIAWKAWREDTARKAAAELVVAASRRLSEYENAVTQPALEALITHFNYEAEWVQAAFGHMEARHLLDTSRQGPVLRGLGKPDHLAKELRGFRANLDNLHRRLSLLDLERDFKPSEWKDRL